MLAVQFEGVSKSYPVYQSPVHRLQELITFNRLKRHKDFWALRDLDFSVKKGETFCIVGENGSGKSTLLQIVAGILQPTVGRASAAGRIAALLELGAGFNPEFTGRDNVFLNGSILGLSKREIHARIPEIEEFAEIGSFIDQPVKTYSSGMLVRLAFSVAIHVEPEILVVDEALAVGDIYFRHRCMRKVHELRARGVTILFVSHSAADVKAIGDRALWLDAGRIAELGPTDKVIMRYLAAMNEKDSRYIKTAESHASSVPVSHDSAGIVSGIPNIDHRYGDARAEILGIAVLDSDGNNAQLIDPLASVVVRISARAHDYLAEPNIGFMMRNQLGIDFAGTNTTREGAKLPPMHPGDCYTVDFQVEIPELYPASFSFSPAIADGPLDGYRVADWIDNAIAVQLARGAGEVYGFLRLPCRVEVNAVSQEKAIA